ncbi:hypothetical protein EDC04DRAFT_2728224, partial [Pisolithus marmoratus]
MTHDVNMAEAPASIADTAASTPSPNPSSSDPKVGDNRSRSDDSAKPSATTSAAPSSSISGPTPPSGMIHMRCLIVTQDASIIIGRGGAHVNEIRDKSGARVVSLRASLATQRGFSTSVVRLDAPCRYIKFMIPNSRMGSVIGKQGCKIKEIQDASGARLNASEGMLPGSTEVSGVADAIHIATYYIGNILIEAQERMPSVGHSSYRPASYSRRLPYTGSSYVPGYASSPTVYPNKIYIPNDLVGCIIGKGGNTLSASQIKIMEPGAGINGAPSSG